MSRSVTDATRNYEAKLRLGACGRLAESEIKRRVDGYSVRAAEQAVAVVMVRQELCNQGVRTIWFPMYHAYARELGAFCRSYLSGAEREAVLGAKVDKWEARGLSRLVLLAVAGNVFNLPLPTVAGK